MISQGKLEVFKSLSTTTELITPELAAEYLKKNLCNRPKSLSHIRKFVRMMKAGQFKHTHQGIAFDVCGDLADGQHRLEAIVESGISQIMQVTRGVTLHAKIATDNGMRVRSASDALQIQGMAIATKQVVAVSRMWMSLMGQHSPASFEIQNFIEDHELSLRYAVDAAGGHAETKHACVVTMLAIGYEVGHGEDLKAWVDVVRSGMSSEPWHTSAIRFRDFWLMNDRGGNREQRIGYCRRIYASMSAWVARRGLEKLYEKNKIEWLDESRALASK